METQNCSGCKKPNKALTDCEVCGDSFCKKCSHFLGKDTFSFLEEVPTELTHTHYCDHCYHQVITPALEEYNQSIEEAKQAYIFFTTQKREPPITNKSREFVEVKECDDRDETILRLAFFAVKAGYNAVSEVEVTSEKVRNLAYQTSKWKGRGRPVTVDVAKLEFYE